MASRLKDNEGASSQSLETFADLQADLFATGFSFSGYERDFVALNLGDGHFLEVSGISGADSVTDGRGSVFADFDNDGDLDVFLRAMHGEAHHLFRNNVGNEAGFVRVTLRGTTSGLDAFGTEVRLKTSAGILTKVKSGGSGFVSQSDPRLLFGIADDAAAEWLEVRWPSGLTKRFDGPQAGSSILIVEGTGAPVALSEPSFSLPDPLGPAAKLWRTYGLDPEVAVPDVEVTLLDGETRRLSSLVSEGQSLLLNLWATWCVPCAREMPVLERIHRDDSARVRIVGLNVETAIASEHLESFLKRLEITYPTARIEPPSLERLIGTSDPGIPLSLVLDHNLRPQRLLVGWSKTTADELNLLLENGE